MHLPPLSTYHPRFFLHSSPRPRGRGVGGWVSLIAYQRRANARERRAALSNKRRAKRAIDLSQPRDLACVRACEENILAGTPASCTYAQWSFAFIVQNLKQRMRDGSPSILCLSILAKSLLLAPLLILAPVK